MINQWVETNTSPSESSKANLPTVPSEHLAELEALHRAYAEGLASRIAALDAAWQTYLAEPSAVEQFATFVRLAHSLFGSSATFGYHAVPSAARALEMYAKDIQPYLPPDAA